MDRKWVLGLFFALAALIISSSALAQSAGISSQDLKMDATLLAMNLDKHDCKDCKDGDKKKDKETDAKLKDFGGFGGPGVTYLNLDLSVLHPMAQDRGIKAFDDSMFLYTGLGGVIYKNFRFGGFGFGGGNSTEGSVGGHARHAHINMGGGGILGELNYTVNRYFGVQVGGMVGAGGMSLQAEGPDMGPTGKWSANKGVFMGYPYGGIWLAPTKWMWVQGNVGYMFTGLDTGGSTFTNKETGVHMTHGNIDGGLAANVLVLFGSNPNIK